MILTYNCKESDEWNEEGNLKALVRRNYSPSMLARLIEVLVEDGQLDRERLGRILEVQVVNMGPRRED